MNIGNGYSSWIHNTTPAGYGSRAAHKDQTGTDKAFFGNKGYGGADGINDNDVTNNTTGKKEAEGGAEKKQDKSTADMTYREQILAHMEEMAKKVKEGKVEPTFQTGAQSFTIREWEKLLADFDDAEEALQEQIKELIAEAEKQAAKEAMRREAEGKPDSDGAGTVVTNVSVPEAAQPETESGGSVANPKTEASGSAAAPTASVASVAGTVKSGAEDSTRGEETASGSASGAEKGKQAGNDNVIDEAVTDPEKLASLLTDEVTKCSYPSDDPKNKHWFITCYTQDGIWCKEAYQENGKWVNRDCWRLSYTEEGQYEKVMAFIQRFPQDANLRFASHENFWKDFLSGEIDEEDFVHFWETSTDEEGVPDYTYEKDGSTYIDREKMKYAKYMNGFGAKFYTGEEMDLIWRAVINENRKGLQKISDYDGQMTIPGGTGGADGGSGDEEEDDLKTRIITKPDGTTVLQIETNFGVMEIEVSEAQKFGLQYNPRQGAQAGGSRFAASPFQAEGAGLER